MNSNKSPSEACVDVWGSKLTMKKYDTEGRRVTDRTHRLCTQMPLF